MGEDARGGRDKVTIVVPEAFASFGLWVEQLVAESTGKHGIGCVPVPTTDPEVGPDRHVVPLHPDQPADIAEQFYRWEVAVAVCGHVLGIDPFDEPNVAESKKNTNDALAALPLPPVETADATSVLTWLSEVGQPRRLRLAPGLPPLRRRTTPSKRCAAASATIWAARPSPPATGLASCTRPASSTRAGPNTVVAVQIVSATPGPELAIPDKDYDFGTLIAAQALGDHRGLVAHGRRVIRVAADDLSAVT